MEMCEKRAGKCIKVEFYYCVYSVVVINYYVTFEGGITYVWAKAKLEVKRQSEGKRQPERERQRERERGGEQERRLVLLRRRDEEKGEQQRDKRHFWNRPPLVVERSISNKRVTQTLALCSFFLLSLIAPERLKWGVVRFSSCKKYKIRVARPLEKLVPFSVFKSFRWAVADEIKVFVGMVCPAQVNGSVQE